MSVSSVAPARRPHSAATGSAKPGRPSTLTDAHQPTWVEALTFDVTCPRCAGPLALEAASAEPNPDRPNLRSAAALYCPASTCRAQYLAVVELQLVGGTAYRKRTR